MAADKNEDPGVLGNLPRSRPGQRSDKRSGNGASASARAPKARARKAPPRPARPAPAPAPVADREPEADTSRSGDPLSVAVHLAGKVAEAGLKTAGGLLRRLPGR